MRKIEIIQTCKGSLDGVNLLTFEEGKEYEVNETLYRAFVKELKVAKEVLENKVLKQEIENKKVKYPLKNKGKK